MGEQYSGARDANLLRNTGKRHGQAGEENLGSMIIRKKNEDAWGCRYYLRRPGCEQRADRHGRGLK